MRNEFSFDDDYPDALQQVLDEGFATTCKFNKWGTLLASGCHDGRIVLWDFDTRSYVKILVGHTHPITSLSWSSNGRKLLSSSTDWMIMMWDVLSGTIEASIRFESPVWTAQLNPVDFTSITACPLYEQPLLVTLFPDPGDKDKSVQWSSNIKPLLKDCLTSQSEEEDAKKNKSSPGLVPSSVAVWDNTGEKLFIGNGKGTLTVLSFPSLEVLKTVQINSAIKEIVFDSSGTRFLVNSTDRILRCFEADSLSQTREFSDLVNRLQWKSCCFSSTSEFVIAGSAQKAQHNIYIWNRVYGNLIKILEGPKEGIMHLVWHPSRPIIGSVSTHGIIHIWASNCSDNWSAYEPGFHELEENEEYIEREDEFDIVEDDVNTRQRIEDEDVDIITVDDNACDWDVDPSSNDPPLLFLPTIPEPD